MHQQPPTPSNDIGTLAEDARALMAATADVAGERVSEARQRLAASLESGRQILEQVKAKAGEGAQAADEAVHEHPYQAIALAFGVGAIIGCLAVCRYSRNDA